MERIDKLLAATGRWSRRVIRDLCRAGRVTANGAAVHSSQTKVPEDAVLTVDGTVIDTDPIVWLMLHKPAGLVSATEDPRQPTVLSLLPQHYQRIGLFPVGRLDKDTEGLLLLTNDGALAHRLLSPKYHVEKVYYAETEGAPDAEDAAALAEGLTLTDGLRCLPACLTLLGGNRVQVTLQEGKYHQVKRMLAARGKPVTYLKRIRFGPLALDDRLELGQWRLLTAVERDKLERAGQSLGGAE